MAFMYMYLLSLWWKESLSFKNDFTVLISWQMEWKSKESLLPKQFIKHEVKKIKIDLFLFIFSPSKLVCYWQMNSFLFQIINVSVPLNKSQCLIFFKVLICTGTEFKNSFPWLFLPFTIGRVLKLRLDDFYWGAMFACLSILKNKHKYLYHFLPNNSVVKLFL